MQAFPKKACIYNFITRLVLKGYGLVKKLTPSQKNKNILKGGLLDEESIINSACSFTSAR